MATWGGCRRGTRDLESCTLSPPLANRSFMPTMRRDQGICVPPRPAGRLACLTALALLIALPPPALAQFEQGECNTIGEPEPAPPHAAAAALHCRLPRACRHALSCGQRLHKSAHSQQVGVNVRARQWQCK